MPSLGLATTAGSGSTGRRPGLQLAGEAVVQALELGLLGLRQIEVGKQPPAARSRGPAPCGFSILLNQPMKRVSAARGMRLVSRKLRSSCSVRAEIRLLTVMNLSAGLVSACVMDSSLPILSLSAGAVAGDRRGRPQGQGAAGAVARQAPLADRTFQDVAPGGAADPVLRIRHRRVLPLRRRAGAMSRPSARTASSRSRRSTASASPRAGQMTAEAASADLRPAIHPGLPRAVPVQPAGARASRHRQPSCSPRPASP